MMSIARACDPGGASSTDRPRPKSTAGRVERRPAASRVFRDGSRAGRARSPLLEERDAMATVRSVAGLIAALLLLTGCYSTEKASTFAELGPDANTKGFGEQFPPETSEGDFTFG